jgi:hypothetical protein
LELPAQHVEKSRPRSRPTVWDFVADEPHPVREDHSIDFFGSERDFWWNRDFLAPMLADTSWLAAVTSEPSSAAGRWRCGAIARLHAISVGAAQQTCFDQRPLAQGGAGLGGLGV